MGNTHRRSASRTAKAICLAVAVVVVGGTAIALTGTAQAASVGAAYSKTSAWSTGYTGQYVITNDSDREQRSWTLRFGLPASTKISTLWNGKHTVSGHTVTVRPDPESAAIPPGGAVTVGFVASFNGKAADPVACRINGVSCAVGKRPAAPTVPSPIPPRTPDSPATARTSPPATRATVPAGSEAPHTASAPVATDTPVAPYVDIAASSGFDLADTARKTGMKTFNLAFVTSGGDCAPTWSGHTDLVADEVARQIARLRAFDGDVRVSFGDVRVALDGAAGYDLGSVCTSVDQLTAAYEKVVNAFRLTKVDFDTTGAALPDASANNRRVQAIARLQREHPDLDVSLTLPAMPTGLTQPGVDLVQNAWRSGVRISTVNIMAMNYGPTYDGDMGQYAIDATIATQAQVKSLLGLRDQEAWGTVAVTPMIGANDIPNEIFTVEDATQLARFARSVKLGWLSMWSANRDRPCDQGGRSSASPTCSSIVQDELAFTQAFGASQG